MNTKPKIYRVTDLLTWIGKAYPTIDDFIQEAQKQGCSRRLPGMYTWIKPGETRVFLAHKNNDERKAYGSIFGYYTIHRIHHIIDDVASRVRFRAADYKPILLPSVRPPEDLEEFKVYIVRRKIIIKHRDPGEVIDPGANILDELWQKWLADTIKGFVHPNGVRDIPLSVEADNLERLCGGASNLSCGRYPGYYACDDLADWIIDQIIGWLTDEPELPELPEDYFWEEVIEEEITVIRRRKHKKAPPGVSRSGRIDLDGIHTRYGKPPANISGLVVFEKPYPLYYHPPEASFRGFQRIDGDALLCKVKNDNRST